MARLHDGSGRDGEILPAGRIAAAVAARALGGVPTLGLAAVMADRAARPQDRLDGPPGGIFVLEVGGGEGVHGVLSERHHTYSSVVSSI